MVSAGFDTISGIKGRRIGYARVLMPDQNIRSQCDWLKEWECHRIFADEGVSGSKAERPANLIKVSAPQHYHAHGLATVLRSGHINHSRIPYELLLSSHRVIFQWTAVRFLMRPYHQDAL